MPQTFRIATSFKLNEFNAIGDMSKVSEELFWMILKSKVKELTESQPEKFDEVIEKAKDALSKSSLTILDTWFEIKGKP